MPVLQSVRQAGVTALGLLLLLAGCEKAETLTKAPSEKEANRILVELEAQGIHSASKVEVKEQRTTAWGITVSAEELSKARSILVENDLPRTEPGGLAAIVESGGLIPTKAQERAKLMYAMSGELERTLAAVDRVVQARVHIVLPERDPLQRAASTQPRPSAMVLIKYIPLSATANAANTAAGATRPSRTGASVAATWNDYADAPLPPEQIQQMVARSVESLAPDDVFVTYTKAITHPTPVASSATPSPSPAAGLNDRKLAMQLFIAVAAFGLLSVVLIALLVKEKRKARQLVAGETT